MFLLDTNTLIYFFKGQGRVAERLLATSPQQLVAGLRPPSREPRRRSRSPISRHGSNACR